jgi:hypothetical protein
MKKTPVLDKKRPKGLGKPKALKAGGTVNAAGNACKTRWQKGRETIRSTAKNNCKENSGI